MALSMRPMSGGATGRSTLRNGIKPFSTAKPRALVVVPRAAEEEAEAQTEAPAAVVDTETFTFNLNELRIAFRTAIAALQWDCCRGPLVLHGSVVIKRQYGLKDRFHLDWLYGLHCIGHSTPACGGAVALLLHFDTRLCQSAVPAAAAAALSH